MRRPQFLIFAISQSVSLFGDKLDYMAMLALIAFFAERGGWDSSRAIAALAVVAALPTVMFGPLAGVFVDRRDRRKVMVLCDSARALMVLAVPFAALATGSIWIIFVIAFAVFLCGLVFNTTRLSVLPNLVSDEQIAPPNRLLAANSFMNVTGRVATLLGMVLGGLIVDWTGWQRIGITYSWSAGFYVDALTYAVSVLGLLLIYQRISVGPRIGVGRTGDRSSFGRLARDKFLHVMDDLRGAWHVMVREPSVLFVYCVVVAFVLIGAGFTVLFIPLVQGGAEVEGLGLGTRGVGILAGIGSVGLILSSLGYGIAGHGLKRYQAVLGSIVTLGIAIAVIAVWRSLVAVCAAAFVAGLAISPVYIGLDTLLHETVPAEARGRVFSTREWIMHVFFAGMAFLLGQLTRVVPKRDLLFVVGVLVAAAGVAGFFLTHRQRIG
ncbi:MAG: MFS transporter [candidate division WOR-3 bacterium]|nr:MAG: MFS transporter [candidate division WOR-3 bacterium]